MKPSDILGEYSNGLKYLFYSVNLNDTEIFLSKYFGYRGTLSLVDILYQVCRKIKEDGKLFTFKVFKELAFEYIDSRVDLYTKKWGEKVNPELESKAKEMIDQSVKKVKQYSFVQDTDKKENTSDLKEISLDKLIKKKVFIDIGSISERTEIDQFINYIVNFIYQVKYDGIEKIDDTFHHLLMIEKPEEISRRKEFERLITWRGLYHEALFFICEKQDNSFFPFIKSSGTKPIHTFFYFRGSESTYPLSKKDLDSFETLNDNECLVETIIYDFLFKLHIDLADPSSPK